VSQEAEILAELHRRGVTLTADGDTLCLKPRRALDDGLLARIRDAKSAILDALRRGLNQFGVGSAACGSPHCAGCYEVEPGVRIHPSKCGETYRKWLDCWQPRGKPQ
jgi:hypothetical protein